MRERELKPETPLSPDPEAESLPMRERELKLDLLEEALVDYRSLPMRERELKRVVFRLFRWLCKVAPHAGA